MNSISAADRDPFRNRSLFNHFRISLPRTSALAGRGGETHAGAGSGQGKGNSPRARISRNSRFTNSGRKPNGGKNYISRPVQPFFPLSAVNRSLFNHFRISQSWKFSTPDHG
jgi:hypothetical protein